MWFFFFGFIVFLLFWSPSFLHIISPFLRYRKKTIAIKPKTAQKLQSLAEEISLGASPKTFQQFMGVIAFVANVEVEGRTNCFFLNRLLADLQRLHGKAFPSMGVVPLGPDELAEVDYWKNIDKRDALSFALDNRKIQNFKVFSDASQRSFGILMGSKQVAGKIPEKYLAEPIIVKEAYGLFYYVKEFAPGFTDILMCVDNKALFYNFQNSASRNFLVNDLIREIFRILKAKKSTLKLFWVSTETMLTDGADTLSRNFAEKFSDEKSISEFGKKKLLKLSGLEPSLTIDLFASATDNPLNTKYAHINWDIDDKNALGKDAFQFLEENFGKTINFHLYAYPPFPLIDAAAAACGGINLGPKGKLVFLVPAARALDVKLRLGRLGSISLVSFCRQSNRGVLKSRAALALTLVIVHNRKRKIF